MPTQPPDRHVRRPPPLADLLGRRAGELTIADLDALPPLTAFAHDVPAMPNEDRERLAYVRRGAEWASPVGVVGSAVLRQIQEGRLVCIAVGEPDDLSAAIDAQLEARRAEQLTSLHVALIAGVVRQLVSWATFHGVRFTLTVEPKGAHLWFTGGPRPRADVGVTVGDYATLDAAPVAVWWRR